MVFDLSLIPPGKGQKYRGVAACLGERLPACKPTGVWKADQTRLKLILCLPGKRFGSVGRGREAMKGRQFLSLVMSQVSFTTASAQLLFTAEHVDPLEERNHFTDNILKCLYWDTGSSWVLAAILWLTDLCVCDCVPVCLPTDPCFQSC